MNFRKEQGLTLIELMVAMSVLIILMTIGVPSMAGYMRSQKLDSTVQLLKDTYNHARYEAVTTQNSVTLCPLDVIKSICGDKWSAGILSYVDNDNDSKFDSTKDDLLKLTAFPEGVEISFNNGKKVRINRSGGTGNSGTFELKVPELESASLIISVVGRIRKG